MPFDSDLKILLLSSHVQSIAFTFLDVVVRPSGYRAVAMAIGNNKFGNRERIRFERNANELHHNGGLMAYVCTENLIVYSRETALATVAGKGLGVHEATHALCDRKGKAVSGLTAEGAAAVAQLWYLMNVGFNIPAGNNPVRDAVNAVRGRNGPRLGTPAVPVAIANAVRSFMQTIGHKNTVYAYDGIRDRR